MKNVSYHALVLKDNYELKSLLNNDPAKEWGIIAHHVTIDLGAAKNHLLPYLGKDFNIVATDIGSIENEVVAVKVKIIGFDMHNFTRTPHITLAVNRQLGIKPFQSNKITKWTPLKKPISLIGTLYNLDAQSNIIK